MKNVRRFSVALMVATLALGLTVVGCGGRSANDGATESDTAVADETTSSDPTATNFGDEEEVASAPPSLEEREAAIAQRERELAVAERERELEAREAAIREQTAPAPAPARPAVKQPEPQPRFETIMVTLPVDTELQVEFLDELSSEVNFVGDPFMTRVAQDVVVNGTLVVPAGSEIQGTVAEVTPAKKIGGQASLALNFDRLRTPDGETATISASLVEAGEKQTKKDALTIGGAAAGGAILGRILDKDHGKKGTRLGALIGAAAGTAVAAKNQGDPVLIERGMLSGLVLNQPTRIAVTVPADRDVLTASQ